MFTLMVFVLSFELGHLDLDNTRIETMPTRTVDVTISDQSQEIVELVFGLLGINSGHNGSSINDVLQSIKKADRARILALLDP